MNSETSGHRGASTESGGGLVGGGDNVTSSASGSKLFTRQYSCHETPPSPSSLRIKVSAVRKMASLWSHIKNSSPVKKAKMSTWMSGTGSNSGVDSSSTSVGGRRSSHHSLFSLKGIRSRKDKLKQSGQHSYSHPDISSGNLANLAFPSSSSRDDMALALINNYPAQCTSDSTAVQVESTAKVESVSGDTHPASAKSMKNQIFSALVGGQSSKELVSRL